MLRAIRRGHLPTARLGGSRRLTVRPSDLETWVYGNTVEPQAPPPDLKPRGVLKGEPGSLARLHAIEAEALIVARDEPTP